MTTGFLEKAFKGISAYYGPDCPVDVEFDVISLRDFTVEEAKEDMTLYADVDLKFWVESVNGTQLAVDLSLTDFEFQASILIVNETQI